MEADLVKNTEFRIKYPRGDLGVSAGEAELFMLVEHMSGQVTKIEAAISNMMHNDVNITRLQEDMKEARENIEKLKDKLREANGG